MALRFFRPINTLNTLRPSFRPNNALSPSPFQRKPVFTTFNCTFWNLLFRRNLRYTPELVIKEPFVMVNKVIFTSEMAPMVHTAKRVGGSAVILASIECPYLLYYMDPIIPPAVQLGFCATLLALAYVPAYYFHTYVGRFIVSMQLQLTEKGQERQDELDGNAALTNLMLERGIRLGQFWALSDEEFEKLKGESYQREKEKGPEQVVNLIVSADLQDAARYPINYDLYCLELTTHDVFGLRTHHHVAFDDLVFHSKEEEWPPVWRVKSTGKLFYLEDKYLWRLPSWISKIIFETAKEEQKIQEAQRAQEEAEKEKEKEREKEQGDEGEYQNYEPKRE